MNSTQYNRLVHSARKLGLTLPSRQDLTLIAKEKQEATHQKGKRELSKPEPYRSRLKQGSALVGSILALVSFFSSGLTLLQFSNDVPDVTPIDFGAKDPFTAQFVVKNTMFTSMRDVEIGSNMGGQVYMSTGGDLAAKNAEDANWRMEEAENAAWACQNLIGSGSVKEAAERNILINEQNYDHIAPKESVRSKTWTMGRTDNSKAVFGIGITYRVYILGIFPLPKKSVCLNFDTETDPSGHAHLIPYKTPAFKNR